MKFQITLILMLVLGTASCDEMEAISQITKFRVMGVQADPPEIQPGEGTVLRVLYADPTGEGRDVRVFWATCVGSFSPTDDLESGCEPLWIPQLPTSVSQGGDVYTIPTTPTDILAQHSTGSETVDRDAGPEDEQVRFVTVTVLAVLCAGGEFPSMESFAPAGEIQLFRYSGS